MSRRFVIEEEVIFCTLRDFLFLINHKSILSTHAVDEKTAKSKTLAAFAGTANMRRDTVI